ncbi:aspartate/glutamate racemase family protein [Parahaliea aestuarii]|uniref:Aspartate/glutamate racemase family protein n=1 Tax=Parahaliea aestuarii TaxID=1852021 RepID=A0A5C8ZND2_9GAMM|nr:aspartate/glutamate racemase family protein [Parahaliea aestuarii]TXS90003.1 aspartate/glutamate racemase family protein [Parahaliea aestuarii]
MKTIGLLGGMSWESTQTYYRLINQGVQKALGGLHSARIVLDSVDFQELADLQGADDWSGATALLVDGAGRVAAAGADCVMICTNTMHKVAPEIEAAVDLPLLHIADAAGKALAAQGVTQIGLLGTAFTMEQDFYRERLSSGFGISTLVPEADDRAVVHRIIYEELCQGQVLDASRGEYLRIIDTLAARGAEAVVLGCTEIGLLVQQEHSAVCLLDTTAVHAAMAVDFALAS